MSKRRYRVVLVRWPPRGPRALAQVLPGGHLPKRDALPVVVRVTTEPETARLTAERLQEAGAGIVVMAEFADLPVICTDHPPELVRGVCRRCAAPVCAGCLLEADGDRSCRRCAQETRTRVQRTHTRQLFVLFLFCAFLYQVYSLWRQDTNMRAGSESIPVALLQFVPPGEQFHPMVRGLSGMDQANWTGPAYPDIVGFFERERQRYTGHLSSTLHLSVRGPWMEHPVPPSLHEERDSVFGLGLAALRYSWFWRRLAHSHGVDLKSFPLRLFVIFTSEGGDQAALSRAAQGGRLAVTYVSLDDPNPAYPAITIAHELAHLLGASDKYDAGGLARYPEGYVEPYEEPIFPQRYGELLAVDIPIGRANEREASSLAQLRIGHLSAAEMGWIAQDEADAFYRAPGVTPDELLDLLPDEGGEASGSSGTHTAP